MVPLSLQLGGFANTVCLGRFGASTSQHGTLLHDDTQFLLALAIADHAIWGVNTLDDLWQLQIPSGDDELPLRWNDSVIHLPILRNTIIRYRVTDEPLLKRSFDRILKSVLNLSGFFGPATVYTIRRFVGKKVNSKFVPGSLSTPILLTEVLQPGIPKSKGLNISFKEIYASRVEVIWQIPLRFAGGQLPSMNQHNMITWTISSPLPNSTKANHRKLHLNDHYST